MELSLKKIIGSLEEALNDSKRFNGIDYGSFLNDGQNFTNQINDELKKLENMLESNTKDFQIVIKKSTEWNSLLKDLLGKYEKEKEMVFIKKMSTDGVLSLSGEERKVLTERHRERQRELDQLIYDLINQNISLQQSYEKVQNQMNEIGNYNEATTNILEDIQFRYQQSLELEKMRKVEIPNVTNTIIKENERDIIVEENNKENYVEIKDPDEIEMKSNISESKSKFINNKEKRNYSSKTYPENEISNTDNWIKFKYLLQGGAFHEAELTYIIQAFKGTLNNLEDVSVTLANSEESLNAISSQYDVLSNIIRIEPTGLDSSFNSNIPWKLSIPYKIIRSPNREIVIYCKDETQQIYYELDTQELLYEESREEGIKLAEAILPSSNCVCVVVSKRKVEKFEINKRGANIESKVDERISLSVLPSSVMISIGIQIIVQPIESGLINELKSRIKSNTLNGIQTISPIVELNFDLERNLLKPALLQLPIAYPTGYVANKNRVFSAGPIVPEKTDRRPKTALTRQISNDTNSFIKLASFNDKENLWKVNKDFKFNLNKNGDAMSIDLDKLEKQKIVALRCTDDLNEDKIQKALELITEGSEDRPIRFMIGQRIDNPNRLILVAGPPNNIDKIQKYILDNDFNEETMDISPEFTVRERDSFKIDFRGNLVSLTETPTKLTYHSQLFNKIEFYVQEKDKFAQKNKDSFQGYISIIKTSNGNPCKLHETVINIPKFDQELNKSVQKDFNFKATDTVNREYLQFLSNQIGEDWKNLAYALRIPEESIKRIANDPRMDLSNMAYSCLLKWIKNTTVYSNKVEIMEKALRIIGRQDLVRDLSFRSINN